NYDAVFITNPSSAHYETLRRAAQFSKAVFIEKPVFGSSDVDMAALGLRQDGVYYVACPLRRAPVVLRMKELAESLRPTAARVICSSYLPDWRPSQDYRRSYSADPALGGGVRLDLIHEWDYLIELFGEPLSITSESGRFSALEITSEDTACYLARYRDMLLTLHLDYTGRAPRREIELFCDEDTVIADIIKSEIRFLRSGKSERLPKTDIHLLEMRYFLDLTQGKEKNVNDVERAMATLRLAER
ncbi:MAG: Gfo/Idh/MocA family oxidoreductase, partial [Oscillospiraceae bacterium]|nr:Gfo/Idh/MocA family oxidoreductase [Oscillospiraceae bacterium]